MSYISISTRIIEMMNNPLFRNGKNAKVKVNFEKISAGFYDQSGKKRTHFIMFRNSTDPRIIQIILDKVKTGDYLGAKNIERKYHSLVEEIEWAKKVEAQIAARDAAIRSLPRSNRLTSDVSLSVTCNVKTADTSSCGSLAMDSSWNK